MKVEESKKFKKGIDRIVRIFEGHEAVGRKKTMDENTEKERRTRGHVDYRENYYDKKKER
jgi:hypothetical protein